MKKLLILLALTMLFSGCERAADGKAWLADREDKRPAPTQRTVMDDLDDTIAAQQADPTNVHP